MVGGGRGTARAGGDVSGAVTFTLPAEPDVPTRFRPITPEELLLRLEQPEIWPLEVWDGRPRLSVAGVQAKLNLLRLEGALGFGEGELCSTHLLKFEHHPHLVINEFVTMGLAALLGMPVARVVPVVPPHNHENVRYLNTKRTRMGHDLPG